MFFVSFHSLSSIADTEDVGLITGWQVPFKPFKPFVRSLSAINHQSRQSQSRPRSGLHDTMDGEPDGRLPAPTYPRARALCSTIVNSGRDTRNSRHPPSAVDVNLRKKTLSDAGVGAWPFDALVATQNSTRRRQVVTTRRLRLVPMPMTSPGKTKAAARLSWDVWSGVGGT